MISNNDLSAKLCKIACELDKISAGEYTESERKRVTVLLAAELHQISNEKFEPSTSLGWGDIRPTNNTKKTYKSKTGRDLPF